MRSRSAPAHGISSVSSRAVSGGLAAYAALVGLVAGMPLLPFTRWFIAQTDPGWADIVLYLIGPMYFVPYLALTVAAGLHLVGVKHPILAGIAVAPSYFLFLWAFHMGGGPATPPALTTTLPALLVPAAACWLWARHYGPHPSRGSHPWAGLGVTAALVGVVAVLLSR